MSDSVRPHRWQPIRLPRPWDSPGKNTGVGCHFLLHMTNLDSKLKSRDITLPTKVCLVKAMVFPVSHVWMWELDHKVESWRIDAFELWCWRKLMRVPWTARRSSQSILKEISPEYSLERLMLTLKLQYFGLLMWRTNSLEKTLMLGKMKVGGERSDRGWDGWMASLTQWTWVWVNSGSWWWTEAWRAAVHGVAKSRTWLSNWTDICLQSFLQNKLLQIGPPPFLHDSDLPLSQPQQGWTTWNFPDHSSLSELFLKKKLLEYSWFTMLY